MEIDAVLEVEAGDPQIAIDFLVSNVNLSKTRLKDLMNKGGVWRVTLSGERHRIRRAMTDILVGEQIEIYYDEAILTAKAIIPELLHDAGQYSVWNKPAGMTLDGTDFGDTNSFRRALDFQFKPLRECFWINAIDYESTGLVVLAHTRKAALAFSETFDPDGFHAAMVHYRADVAGEIPEQLAIVEPLDDQLAQTRISRIRYDARPDRSVIDIWLETGRTDQARRHLAGQGYPVVGDEVYGRPEEDATGLRLRAVELSFDCPVTGQNRYFSLVK
ncbi:pseudouridine synthase family protein [Reinekea sp.]|jgi:tRNA pseudouridine32 synthase/23S rRNA pseudouridine746 synthase|uniref:pseudouridine synthase family protein n=1 Tax=Reinekea sp. TaxID=1970455 RepID=UPI002A816251|nr:pseudouridine synthase [Reinekea sp.]